jgi:hypothetical protein
MSKLLHIYQLHAMTYTLMSRKASSAEGDCGIKKTDAAIKKAMNEHTVVKKPKTFWIRVNPECILKNCVCGGMLLQDEVKFEKSWLQSMELNILI